MIMEPYQTTVLSAFAHRARQMRHQLEVGYLQDELHPVTSGDDTLAGVLELVPDSVDVEAMVAPILIHPRDGVKTVFDARANRRIKPGMAAYLVNPSDYYFARREAVLTQLWNTEGPERMSSLDALPIRVFARWLADGVARRLDLNALDRLRVEIVSAYYYTCQMRKAVPASADSDSLRQYGFANLISRALGANLAMVVDILSPLGFLANEQGNTDIHCLVDAIKGDGSNVRLALINPGMIFTMLNGSWFGAHASFIVGRALEYPPSFLAMLYSAITNHTQHKSYFARTVQQADRQNQSRDLVAAMNHLARGLTDG